jgi:predicted nucleic acid-binding protein
LIYLLDTSALVRLLRDPKLQEGWYDAIDAEAIGSCYPQRAEFLYSARHAAEYDEIAEMFGDLYPDVAVPKTAGRWISTVQYQMARVGQHRSASPVDLIIAATAAHHGLTVLHDDADYRTVARHSPDLAEQNINDLAS